MSFKGWMASSAFELKSLLLSKGNSSVVVWINLGISEDWIQKEMLTVTDVVIVCAAALAVSGHVGNKLSLGYDGVYLQFMLLR